MGLNYTDGCVNSRDVGEYLELITGKSLLPHGKLYRGGSIDHVKSLDEIGHAATVINLRNRADYQEFDIEYLHFPMSDKVEKYDTSQKDVRRWVNGIVKTFEQPELRYPVLVHCLSGKDRTGIIIAALLLILGVEKEVIIEEYLLSEGEVKRDLITQAMDGMLPLSEYFNQVDLEKVRAHLR